MSENVTVEQLQGVITDFQEAIRTRDARLESLTQSLGQLTGALGAPAQQPNAQVQFSGMPTPGVADPFAQLRAIGQASAVAPVAPVKFKKGISLKDALMVAGLTAGVTIGGTYVAKQVWGGHSHKGDKQLSE